MSRHYETSPLNAEIVIDYTTSTKKVDFNYPSAKGKNIFWQEYLSINSTYGFPALIFLVSIYIIYIILAFLDVARAIWLLLGLPILGITYFILMFFMMFLHKFSLTKATMAQFLPAFNAWMSFHIKGGVTYEEIKKINKLSVVRKFDNVFLEYEATGQFSKYLKKIFIVCKGSPTGNDYEVKFKFSKVPKTGLLYLKYTTKACSDGFI